LLKVDGTFSCCAKRSAGAAVAKYHNLIM